MKACTSDSHPMQIATLPVRTGRIGISFCPGKHQADAMSGVWARDLATDLDAVRNWGAAAVVTLVEAHELSALKVEALGDEVGSRGMSWFHLPIRDVSVPGPLFEEGWREAGGALRELLRSGKSVFVHCKGGLGRAGTVAARLLVELGEEPDAAIAKVREVRSRAIETKEQEDYVRAIARGGLVPER